ncbi:MAG: stage III sporulation protein AF [Lachnospiraceae bacterium]
METIVESIRNVGIFMIAAQAVMHFSPGKRYEKYIKLIAGVMVLLMFIHPFAGITVDFESEWESGMNQIIQQLGEQSETYRLQNQSENPGVWNTTLQQIEEQAKARLNLLFEKDPYRVAEVQICLQETQNTGSDSYEWSVEHICVVMERKEQLSEEGIGETVVSSVQIEKIDITANAGQQEQENEGNAYTVLCADALGIEKDRVEVICRGGW